MLDAIKQAVFAQFNPEEKKGLFVSGFSQKKELVYSQGVVESDQPVRSLIESLYESVIEPDLKKTRYIVCDIVVDVLELAQPQDVLTLSPEEYGFVVVDQEDDASGVILPNTSGVADAKSALAYAQQKYGLHGGVIIYAFRTERIVVAK